MTDSRPVLVVDDDPALRDVIQWALTDEGFDVITAENGAVALRVIEHTAPCAILLDMRMPVMDGWAFARSYREWSGPHAPVIVLTAAQDAAEWARDVQAAGHLGKPFELPDLLETLKRTISRQQPEQLPSRPS
jgi:two-component system chemotaxis response regulator CheY